MKKLIITTVALMAGACMTWNAGEAKENWDKHCAKCHGADGKGETEMGKKLGAKDYTDTEVQTEMKDDAAFKVIKEGQKDKDGKTVKKPAEGLSDEEIKALVQHARDFKK